MDMKKVIEYFTEEEQFTKEQFSHVVREANIHYSDSSISWLLSELKKENKITNIGRGVYTRVSLEGQARKYSYEHSDVYKEIEETICEQYPLIDFQMWELYQMNEFVNHLYGKNTIFVEVEHMCEDPVFDMLHRKYPHVLFTPSKDMYYKQRGDDNTIVVQRLISEAPRPIYGHSATLEKLLVDLFSKKLTGKIISRSEYPAIYEEAFANYDIDETKMFRYARRRSLEAEIKKFLRQNTNVVLMNEEI